MSRGKASVICRASQVGVGFWVTVEMGEPSSMVTKNDHGIQQLKRRGRDHEHVDRGDGCHMIPQEAAPSRGGSLRALKEVPADSRVAQLDAELEQFAVDARRAPERIANYCESLTCVPERFCCTEASVGLTY